MSHEEHEFRRLEHLLRRMDRKLNAVLDTLGLLVVEEAEEDAAKSAVLYISDSKGNRLMPAQLAVGKTAVAVLHEFDGLNGTGNELAPIGPVTYTSSDPTIATVDANTGLVTAVAPGAVTITGTDSGNNLSASDTVSDTAVVAQSATLVITPQ
jgi:hypothetical protein